MHEEDMDLFGDLKRYAASDMYPFHMPGHKRSSHLSIDPYAIDITEIEGFDNLHHPEGRLKDSMEWATSLYGADRTYYLVNGSTCGILAAVSAVVPFGGKIVLARNAHKSAYHAVALNHLKTDMTYPQKVDKLGIFGGTDSKNVDNILSSDPEVRAVLVVSPTYDGVISDIASIAKAAHGHGVPLIVDEAHGAHFKFTSEYTSAIDLGADIVVQSLHKTLPALTQTALLHVKGPLVDTERIERYLQIFQSSSPSYILLGSIEACIRESAANAPSQWDAHYRRVANLRESLGGLSAITLPHGPDLTGMCGIYLFDESRILISVKDCLLKDESAACRAVGGKWLADVLRQRYHIETEMAADTYVLAITTPYDTDEGFERLRDALTDIDGELTRIHSPVKRRVPQCERPKACMTIADALDAKSVAVPVPDSLGCIAAEFVYPYPPGIPLIVPGERIDKSMLRSFCEWREKGIEMQGMADRSSDTIKVVRE